MTYPDRHLTPSCSHKQHFERSIILDRISPRVEELEIILTSNVPCDIPGEDGGVSEYDQG